ncbi:MAG: FHA domain-containing protein [Deltaproteobacteria bacterium]|nr:FHA domain-containing protein [Deltaproteobacteria bacterium]
MPETPAKQQTIGDLLHLLSKGPDAFAEELGGWVLVGQIPDAATGWAFRTASLKGARAVRAPTGEVEAMLDEQWAALVIKKRPGSGFADTIFVGRATSNDVCVPHTSVSKLHARIRRVGDAVFLQDGGSSNGTLINGDVVAAGVDVALVHGDLVRFGSIVLQCFDPRRLHSVLVRFMNARKEELGLGPTPTPRARRS